MPSSERKFLVVLGMHRSGVAVLGECLRGLNAAPAAGDAFAHQDIVLIHDLLLRDLGCRWDMVGALPQGWRESQAAAEAKARILHLWDRTTPEGSIQAIYDPRLCRLLPLWLAVFQEKGIQPGLVLMARHPYEVARSLQDRDGFDLVKGHLLWLVHNREALAVCRGYPLAILTYDQWLADPLSSLEGLGRNLSLDFSGALEQNYRRIIELVRPDYKRHQVSAGTNADSDAFTQYARLYDQFRLGQIRGLPSQESALMLAHPESVNAATVSLQALETFPLTPGQGDQGSAAIFNDLLAAISQYERRELDQAIQIQRRLLLADRWEGGLPYARIFFADGEAGNVIGVDAQKQLLALDEWQRLSMPMPNLVEWRRRPLCISPLNGVGMVHVSAINWVAAATNQTLWAATPETNFAGCRIEGAAVLLERKEVLLLCATGADARILIDPLPSAPDTPARLEVWLKVSRDLPDVSRIWNEFQQAREAREAEVAKLTADAAAAQQAWAAERQGLTQTVQAREAQAVKLTAENQALTQAMQEREAQAVKMTAENQALTQAMQERETELAQQVAEWAAVVGQQERNQAEIATLTQDRERLIGQQQEAQQREEQQQALIAALTQDKEHLSSQYQRLQQQQQTALERQKQDQETIAVLNRDKTQLIQQKQQQQDLAKRYYTELSGAGRQHAEQQQQLQALQQEKQTLIAQYEDRLRQVSADYAGQIEQLRQADNLRRQENDRLYAALESLAHNFQALLASARWRTGNRLIRMVEILLLRKKQPLAADYMREIFSQVKGS